MKLYEINESINRILLNGLVIDDETGEVLLDEEDLDALELEREEKIENLLLYIKDLNAEAKAIKEEKQALEQRQKAAEKKSARLKEYVQGMLDGEKFSTPKASVAYRKTRSIKVDDMIIAPEWCKISYSPDKTAIKKALQAGETVVGAELVESVSMSIK